MQEFWVFIKLGFYHITDFGGYDHLLFIIALSAVYQIREWRKILIIVTAFTIGHSITLALATYKIIILSPKFIEAVIPITILFTAIVNLFSIKDEKQWNKNTPNGVLRYLLAICFGLIHGLGFSNYLRVMIAKSGAISIPLLGFNIGLEVGQLVVLFCFLSISSIFIFMFDSFVRVSSWKQFISGAVAGISITLLIKTFSGE